MKGTALSLLILSLGFATAANAQTEIHKCTDADGGIVYSQLPCAPAKPGAIEADQAEETANTSPAEDMEQEIIVQQAEEGPSKPAEEVAACKKQFRDRIDVIDAEIQREYSQEKADDYKQRLLQLTRQLRLC